MTDKELITTTTNLPVFYNPRNYAGPYPAEKYLASLAEGSGREGAKVALRLITRLLTTGRTEDYNLIDWSAMRFNDVMVLREQLEKDYLYVKNKKAISENGEEEIKATVKPLKHSTINHALSVLRSVLKIAWQLGLMDGEDYQLARSAPNVRGSTVPAGRLVSKQERENVFEVCENDHTKAGFRDTVIFGFACMLGMRREEIANVQISDYNPVMNTLKIVGKGNKERINYLEDNLLLAYQDWVQIRGSHEGSLFQPINKGNKINMRVGITAQGIAKIIDKRRIEAGVAPFTPHDLRRSLISDLLDEGVDFAVIAKWVGHSSISTTAKYDRRPDERVREASRKLQMPYRERSLDNN